MAKPQQDHQQRLNVDASAFSPDKQAMLANQNGKLLLKGDHLHLKFKNFLTKAGLDRFPSLMIVIQTRAQQPIPSQLGSFWQCKETFDVILKIPAPDKQQQPQIYQIHKRLVLDAIPKFLDLVQVTNELPLPSSRFAPADSSQEAFDQQTQRQHAQDPSASPSSPESVNGDGSEIGLELDQPRRLTQAARKNMGRRRNAKKRKQEASKGGGMDLKKSLAGSPPKKSVAIESEFSPSVTIPLIEHMKETNQVGSTTNAAMRISTNNPANPGKTNHDAKSSHVAEWIWTATEHPIHCEWLLRWIYFQQLPTSNDLFLLDAFQALAQTLHQKALEGALDPLLERSIDSIQDNVDALLNCIHLDRLQNEKSRESFRSVAKSGLIAHWNQARSHPKIANFFKQDQSGLLADIVGCTDFNRISHLK